MSLRLGDAATVRERLLRETGYVADDLIADVLFLADGLDKPLLVEGPAGVGKTELAKAAAALTGSRLLRLQCYEGLDEAKALYEWNYKKQLLRIQADDGRSWEETEANIFTEDFLLERPLLAAIRSAEPVVLLIDEVDRIEVETEALLLEVLSDFQISIPELGTIAARQVPLVILTSNATRDLSEALKRRCLYLHLDYPDAERERQIIELRVPDIKPTLAAQAARVVHAMRALDLHKPPSISETVDWARSLVLLGVTGLEPSVITRTLPVLIKNQPDRERAITELDLTSAEPCHDAAAPRSSQSWSLPILRWRSWSRPSGPSTTKAWRSSGSSTSCTRSPRSSAACSASRPAACWPACGTCWPGTAA